MEITEAYVCDFYKANPTIDFVEVNIQICKLFESLQLKTGEEFYKKISITHAHDTDNIVLHNHKNNCYGETGEKLLEVLLNKIVLNAEVTNVGHLKNQGDFCIQRENHTPIMVMNKVSHKNVGPEEIQDFLAMMKENGRHGIFISQHSGFVNKNDYQIDFVNGNIVVFLHNVNYCMDKIQNAIQALDSLSSRMKNVNTQYDEYLTEEVIYEINKEYQNFITKKDSILYQLKENQRALVIDIESLQFMNLDKYLSTKFTIQKKNDSILCTICKKYSSNTLKGMAAHKRGCKKKHPHSHAHAVSTAV